MSLGKLLINVGANIADFESDMGRAARIAQKRSESIKREITVATKAVAAGLGAAASGALLMVKNTANAGDQLDKMSRKLGVSVEFLSKYDYQATLAGASLDTVGTAAKKLQKSINDADNGLSTAIRGFDALGLSVEDLKKLSPEEQFQLVSEKLGGLADQSKLTGTAMDLLGRSGADLIPLFKTSKEEIEKTTKQIEDFGAVMSTAQSQQGAAFNDALTTLSKNAEGFRNVIAGQLTPALTELINQFNDGTIRDSAGDWTVLQSAVVGAYGSVLLFSSSFEIIGDALGAVAVKVVGFFKELSLEFQIYVQQLKSDIAGIKAALNLGTLQDFGKELIDLEALKSELETLEKTNDQFSLLNTVADNTSAIVDGASGSLFKLVDAIKKGNKELEGSAKIIPKADNLIVDLGKSTGLTSKQFEKLAKDFKSIADRFLTPLEKLESKFQDELELIDEWINAQDDFDKAIIQAANLTNQLTEEFENNVDALNEVAEAVEEIDFESMFDGFAEGLNPAISALGSFKDELKLINELDLSNGEKAFYKTGITAEFALSSMANMAQEGSEAQKKLQAAAAITNTILGITAILEQGKGDPYTAFARMASMAVLVASLGVQIAGAFGGGSSGGAQQQQAIQGTGTVLGDDSAQSESIVNALDLIASASDKIVGINSRMLRSLDSMNNAITGTVNQIAQTGEIGNLGTTAGGFSGFGGIFGTSGITRFIDSLIFGSSEITDRGIQILSGGITELINGTLIQAYEVATRSGLFSSSTSTNTAGLAEGITSQLGLIFQSMQEAVLAGAEALGVNLDQVQAALDAYRIEEQRISLLDLDPAEQTAQLQAVFSSIFDGLVNVSIPFITQFQQAGEGLGETLARVSTTVLVFEEAIQSMGLDFIAKQIDPELFAQAAVAISEFAGGLESFIDGYSSYVSNFLSDAEQMEILTERLSGVFGDLGIDLPDTRDLFTDLIQSLDLTTIAGQEAFGTLIALSSEMDSYYNSIEEAQQDVINAREQLADIVSQIQESNAREGLSDFAIAMRNIQQALDEQIATAIRLGASERELTMIRNYADRQFRDTIRNYEQIAQQLSIDIFGSVSENLINGLDAQLNGVGEQISLLEQQQQAAQAAADAAIQAYNAQQQALESIAAFAESLLTGQFSPLNPAEQLAIAQSQFDEAVARARGGDVDAGLIQSLANTLLGLGQTNFASGQANTDIFNNVYETLAALGLTAGTQQSTGGSVGVPSGLQQLYDLQAQLQQELTDAQLASDQAATLLQQEQLLQMLRELSAFENISIQALADRLNIPLQQLIDDLGINLRSISAAIQPISDRITDFSPSSNNDDPNTIVADAITNEGGETQEEIRTLREEVSGLRSDMRDFMAQVAAG